MKRSFLPFMLLVFLCTALAGGVLVMRNGFSTTPVLLLVIGLGGSAGLGLRVAGMGGIDQREVSKAIHERAQKNLELEKGRNPQA